MTITSEKFLEDLRKAAALCEVEIKPHPEHGDELLVIHWLLLGIIVSVFGSSFFLLKTK